MTIVWGIVDDVLRRLRVGSSSSPVGCLLLWGAVSSWLGLRPVGSGCHCPRAQPSATAGCSPSGFSGTACGFTEPGPELRLRGPRPPPWLPACPRARAATAEDTGEPHTDSVLPLHPPCFLGRFTSVFSQFDGHFLLEYLFCYLATGQLVGVEPAGVPSSLRGRGCTCSCPSSHWSSYSDQFVTAMRMVSPV